MYAVCTNMYLANLTTFPSGGKHRGVVFRWHQQTG